VSGALVLVEHAGGAPDEISLQALALARSAWSDAPPVALLIGSDGAAPAAALGAHGVERAFVASGEGLDPSGGFAPDAWAAAVVELAARLGSTAIVAAGGDRGNDVLARVAARVDQPFAANCVEASATADGAAVVRIRWGGSLLEEAALHGSPALVSVAPHAVAATQAAAAAAAAVETFQPALAAADLRVRALERVAAGGGGISLSDARVVVSGGRGVGSSEGFAVIEELAGLLGAAVGCSRAVTMAGWRPHSDQVGQTGTKIAPDIYIACGISGATQHMAGCKGAKRLLAINPDREAPILAAADYAVIGDLHEVVPALSAAIRKTREAA
jgi:electron transfer flavoprotein alpha subunit